MKKIVVFLISFFAFYPILSYANISISPLRFEFDAQQWETIEDIVRVTNQADESVTLYTSKEDFVAGDETGNPQFVERSELPNPELALSTWIEMDQETVTLGPWETREIPFQINVPEDAEPGGSYGALFFSPWAGDGQVAVVQRLGALMLVDVDWEVEFDVGFESFDIGTIIEDEFSSQDHFDSFPINFKTRIKNDGNVHVSPTWKIEIIDEDWEALEDIGKERITSPEWAFMWEELVDYIPINDAGGNVLPNSIRAFESTWEGFGYNVLDEEWRQRVEFRDLQEHFEQQASEEAQYLNFWESIEQVPVEKQFTAQMEVSYNTPEWEVEEFYDEQEITIEYKENKVVVNRWIVGAGWGILLLIFVMIYVYNKRREEKLREQIKQEMSGNSKE